MSKHKHTPGPWKQSEPLHLANHYEPNNVGIVHSNGDGTCTYIATVVGNATSQAVTTANARLIAASPELLVALEAAKHVIEWDYSYGKLKHDDSSRRVVEQIDAAIAAATKE